MLEDLSLSHSVADNNASLQRIYVCNLAAYRANLCSASQLGRFIIDMPPGLSANSTSIFTTAVRFDSRAATGDGTDAVPATINSGPFNYSVTRTGYYCVGAVPVTISTGVQASTDDLDLGTGNSTSTTATAYTGVVDFENTFEGHLPAAEYPKIFFYGALADAYIFMGAGWGFLCWKYRGDILPVQHYVSATIAVIVVETIALSGYYRYLNHSGVSMFHIRGSTKSG